MKIERTLSAGLAEAPAGAAVVTAVVELGHTLGMTVIAEGVETQAESDEVQSLGCEFAQGYLFARPMPADAIGAQLAVAGWHAN